jgi:hypothetical protein
MIPNYRLRLLDFYFRIIGPYEHSNQTSNQVNNAINNNQ